MTILTGGDPNDQQTNLPTATGISYQQLYPGIDLRYEGAAGQLKSAYIVAPGADPTQIRLHYDGVDHIAIDPASGDLQLTLPPPTTGVTLPTTIIEHAPVAWQELNGVRSPVNAHYVLLADSTVGFAVSDYNPAAILTIDPTVTLGSFGSDNAVAGTGIAIDNAAGRAYIAGSMYDGTSEAFVAVLRLDTLVQEKLVYLSGSADEQAEDIAVDRFGAVYVTGSTNSDDFPSSEGFHDGVCGSPEYGTYPCSDMFVVRLSQTMHGLAIDASILLGGSEEDHGRGIAVGGDGDAYVAGHYGYSDASVARLHYDADNRALTPVYAVPLQGDGAAWANAIAVDGYGNAYITGSTYNHTDYNDVNAYVAKLNPAGSTLWQKHYGAGFWDTGFSIALDTQGRIYLSGTTFSVAYFPSVNPLPVTYPGVSTEAGQRIGFAGMLANNGDPLYFTLIAGDSGGGIAVDTEGRAYITTYRTLWLEDGFEEHQGVLLTIEPDGTHWGYDQVLDTIGGSDVALDAAANAYVAGDGKIFKVGSNQESPLIDSDGDALPDEWEINGYRYTDVKGVEHMVDLPAMGADPRHKDIFVEIDYMGETNQCTLLVFNCVHHDHRPYPRALDMVTQAFHDAPVPNPDRVSGITLHIDAGPDSVMNPHTGARWGALSQSEELSHDDNTVLETEAARMWDEHFKPERVPVFRYTVFAHEFDPNGKGPSGHSGVNAPFLSGRLMILVTLGSFTDQRGDLYEQAGTFMHELGHSLGLDHGGPGKIAPDGQRNIEFKPNYLSVMSYAYQMMKLEVQRGATREQVLDYARFALPPPPLDEHLYSARVITRRVILSGGRSRSEGSLVDKREMLRCRVPSGRA